MPNNNSIDRNSVLNHLGDLFTLCRETGSITEKDLESFEKIIKSLSPVTTEMIASEYIKQQFRMCMTQRNSGGCEGCPLSPSVMGLYCDIYEVLYPEKAVAVVTEWAKEHKERNNDNNVN